VTAQTWQCACVITRSGASSRIRSVSIRYSGSPARILRFTSASISRLETEMSKAGSVHCGSERTHAGLSHSCERPTSWLPAPRAQTISVPLASRERILTSRSSQIRAQSRYPQGVLSTPAGLCETCRNVRRIHSDRGSIFYLCELSFTDARFKKYPALPVLECSGFQPGPEPSDDPASA
jgi:hypothetical protein